MIKFGSAARGDKNICSDQDFIGIHSEGYKKFQYLKNKFPNISFLSESTVKRMKNKGALFLTHLDLEGIPIEGDKDMLTLIKGYKPASFALKNSLSSTKHFFNEIQWFPNSTIGTLWLLDVLFVAIRNYIYCHNATQNIYKFSYTEALYSFGVNEQIMADFLKIRDGKYIFRSQQKEPSKLLQVDLQNIENACRFIFGDSMKFKCGGKTNWEKRWKFDYWDERFIERAILNGESKNKVFCSLLKNHNYNRKLFKKAMKKIVFETINLGH
ncbi:hypothetical protein [Desulfobacter vibrioformis]|uniref:hypothetical protein n=1 Tax=Desulfobacter vibrioformis TaxID=34031 RepID=UPI0012EB32B5|nr:hypothetical protein [Desulfobacter vibrioformis]